MLFQTVDEHWPFIGKSPEGPELMLVLVLELDYGNLIHHVGLVDLTAVYDRLNIQKNKINIIFYQPGRKVLVMFLLHGVSTIRALQCIEEVFLLSPIANHVQWCNILYQRGNRPMPQYSHHINYYLSHSSGYSSSTFRRRV